MREGSIISLSSVAKPIAAFTKTQNTMAETTVTLGCCDLDCTFTVSGGGFKGDHMQPADPIEIDIHSILYGDGREQVEVYGLIDALGGIEKVETLILESL